MTEVVATPAQADATTPVPVDTTAAPEAQKPATTTAAPAETESKDAGEPEAAPETPEKDDPKKQSFKERINRVTADKEAARREASVAKQEAAELRKQLAAYQQQARDLDPQDVAGQQALNTRFAVKAERLEQTEAKASHAGEIAAVARQAQFDTKIDAARERIPDLDQALASFAKLPVSSFAADLIAESDKAAEIAYFLSRNPAEAYRIDRLDPHQQGAEIARIEARVSTPARKASSAPPPVRTNIGGGASPTTKSLSELASSSDASAYIAARRAEMAKGS